MNLSIHANHWLHHHQPPAQTGKSLWDEIIRHDIFWIFTVGFVVLAIVIALAFWIGDNPQFVSPYLE